MFMQTLIILLIAILIVIAYELWQIVRSGISRLQDQALAPAMAEAGD